MIRRFIATALLLLLSLSLFASYTCLSGQFEVGLDEWHFGDSDKYRTEEVVMLSGISLGHYHFRNDRALGWNARFSGYVPVDGNHSIYDTKNDDAVVEKCDLVVHNLPIGLEVALGLSIQKYGLILSIDPTASLDTWNYGFPTLSVNLGVEVEGAINLPVTERWNILAGARIEYDYARYMIGWVSAPISNGWITDYNRIGVVPFLGISFN